MGGDSKYKADRSDIKTPLSLGELFRRYAPEITAHVRRRVGAGPPDADDITQQIV